MRNSRQNLQRNYIKNPEGISRGISKETPARTLDVTSGEIPGGTTRDILEATPGEIIDWNSRGNSEGTAAAIFGGASRLIHEGSPVGTLEGTSERIPEENLSISVPCCFSRNLSY